MARYYMAKPTGILYKVDGEYVYYFHNQAREWRLCHAHFQHEIENHPEYFIQVDNVTVA